MTLLDIADELAGRLDELEFGPPVTHVYNPLVYAREPFARYLKKYGRGKREIVMLGMNPGPWGMAQTGVPFGEVNIARDWLKVSGKVGHPPCMHPARVVSGFECHRSEVSGARLWGWARDRFGTPEAFFSRFFVLNYCPLLFLASTGEKTATNVTPDKLRKDERAAVQALCDEHLRGALKILRPSLVIGVGGFAQSCAKRVLEGSGVSTGVILHPSPASPLANRGWAEKIEEQLFAMDVKLG